MSEGNSLRRHLVDELRDLLDAEQQLTRALPQLADAASTPALKQAFQKHHKETERQLDRLNRALGALGEAPRAKRCVGMRGLLEEANTMVGTTPAGALRDAIMISGAQRVEHYEMAAYGTARTYADLLGRSDVARLLDDTLREEKAADAKLTEIAEDSVNDRAAQEWHKQSAGVLNQSAEWMGQTVGAAARTVRRAAGAVGLSNFDPEQAVDTVRGAASATSQTVADTAQAAVRQGRRLSKRAVKTARSVAADVMPSAGTRKKQRPGTAGRARQTRKAGKRRQK